jgi:hypothetical protein
VDPIERKKQELEERAAQRKLLASEASAAPEESSASPATPSDTAGQPEPADRSVELARLDLERRKLDLEVQKLELDRQRLELEAKAGALPASPPAEVPAAQPSKVSAGSGSPSPSTAARSSSSRRQRGAGKPSGRVPRAKKSKPPNMAVIAAIGGLLAFVSIAGLLYVLGDRKKLGLEPESSQVDNDDEGTAPTDESDLAPVIPPGRIAFARKEVARLCARLSQTEDGASYMKVREELEGVLAGPAEAEVERRGRAALVEARERITELVRRDSLSPALSPLLILKRLDALEEWTGVPLPSDLAALAEKSHESAATDYREKMKDSLEKRKRRLAAEERARREEADKARRAAEEEQARIDAETLMADAKRKKRDAQRLRVTRAVQVGRSARTLVPHMTASLSWLARHQSSDGSWDSDGWTENCSGDSTCSGAGTNLGDQRYDVGLTSLAVLAFQRTGHTQASGDFSSVVKQAVQWLVRQQKRDGSIGFTHGETIYNHALATIALCEVRSTSDDQELSSAAARAVDFCLRAQLPGRGWKYRARSGRNDTSVTGWMFQALVAGKKAGFEVSKEALAGALAWFTEATNSKGVTGYETKGGGSAFLPQNDGRYDPVPCMTAVAAMCRGLAETVKLSELEKKGVDLVFRSSPAWKGTNTRRVNFYYWHYGVRAINLLGGKRKAGWNKALYLALLPNQRVAGCECVAPAGT